MKITPQMLSLPPYISTTWANIASLRVVQHKPTGSSVLIIELLQGNQVEVPGLEPAAIDAIFAAHENALESAAQSPALIPAKQQQDPLSFAFNLPLKLFGEGLHKMGGMLQHNPEAADAPDLPQEIVEKIASFVHNLGISESTAIPLAEEGCNCTFCQVAKAISNAIGPKQEELSTEESVSEEDLRFRTWDIAQKGDRLYLVTNPIDETEQYHVYLGEPLGCTCGQRDCEHIRAVLRT
jgi:hypothetical protein